MAQLKSEIVFDPNPRRIGLQWRVVATHSNGQKEHISGFADQAEALEWLASNSCQAWRMARLIARGDAI